jgi:tetratricopeptide (TPR) repeat protein
MQGLTQAKGGLSAVALAISVVAALAIAPAFANPGGGGGGGTGGGGSTGGGSGGSTGGTNDSTSSGNTGLDNLTCREGFVVDPRKHICVQEQSSVMPDEDLINTAFALTEDGRYQDALDTLDRLQNPHTAVALNYRGYATRKAGRVDEGIGYYLQSVAIDPAYPQVREYLGEAYVLQGKLGLANEQLVVIASLCGTTCEAYIDLAEAIDAAE